MGASLKNTATLLLLLAVLQLPVLLPLSQDGYYTSHDDFSVQRVIEYRASILAGDIPARWSANLLNGYGYPLFVFYSPLVYATGAVISLAGITPLAAIKIISALSILAGTSGMFLLTKLLTKNNIASFAASVIYAYAPYRATDLYVRGAIAEFVGLSLLPWLLYTLWLTIKKSSVPMGVGHGLLLGAFIATHHITAMIFALLYLPFVGYTLFLHKESLRAAIRPISTSIVVALSTSSWYWIPLLVESKYINTTSLYAFPLNFFLLTVSDLWDSPWGYGGVLDADPMSLQIGKVLFLIIGLLTLMTPFLLYKRRYSILFWLGIFYSFGFLELQASAFIWDSIPLLHVLRIPWRLHMVLITVGAMLTAMLLNDFWRYAKQAGHMWVRFTIIIGIILLTMVTQVQFFRPKILYSGYFPHETTTWDDEYLPQWVTQKPPTDTPGTRVLSGNATLTQENAGYRNRRVTVEARQLTTIEFPVIWYPGWLAYLDKKPAKTTVNQPHGTVAVSVPEGRHIAELRFTKTWWRIATETVSLGAAVSSLIFLAQVLFCQYKKRRSRHL